MGAVVAQDGSGSSDVGNGACEPAWSVPIHSACQRGRESMTEQSYALSCISIDSEPVTVLPLFGGDFSGEEKIPEIASIPCSSRARSSKVIPVFLRTPSALRALRNDCLFIYLPCTPTLKKAFSRFSRFFGGAILVAVNSKESWRVFPQSSTCCGCCGVESVDRLFGCARRR